MPRMPVGDCSLYVERHGAGFPVLLISGLGGLASFWREQTAAFARTFEVIQYDHRGIGQSDPHLGATTIDRMAEDVVRLLDTLGIERAHMVGHSAGGAIAQTLAIEHAGRCAGVVIAASWPKSDAYFRRQFEMRRSLLSGLGPALYVQAGSLLLYPHAWIAANNETLRGIEAQTVANFPPVETMLARIDALLAFDRTAGLGRIKAPTMVVGTADDNVTPAYYSEWLARSIPGAEFKLFPEGGHAFPQLKARDFNAAVLPFLQAHTPAAPQPTA